MTDLYRHDPHKFSDNGLQLRLPVDLIPSGEYGQLTNALTIIEGQLISRPTLDAINGIGTAIHSPSSGVQSIFRLVQPNFAQLGARVVGYDSALYSLVLPAGSSPVLIDTIWSGNPLSFISYRYQNLQNATLVIGDRENMAKLSNSIINELPLGMPTPINSIFSASEDGSGNLDNGSGPEYQWIWTFYDTVRQVEGNPSPIQYEAGQVVDIRPTTYVSPDPDFGGNAGTAIALPGSAVSGTLTGSAFTETWQSVKFSGFTTDPTATYASMQLFIACDAFAFGTSGTTGLVYAVIYYSIDNGTSWHVAIDTSIGFTRNYPDYIIINLPPDTQPANVLIRAGCWGVGADTTAPQNVRYRRIRDAGGNLTPTATGVAGTNSMQLTFTDIFIRTIPVDATEITLALSNKQAEICLIESEVSFWASIQANAIRLYRFGGANTQDYALVGTFHIGELTAGGCGAGYLSLIDNVADANLGPFVNRDNDAPVTSVFRLKLQLPYIWGPHVPSGLPVILATGDPDRPGAVYFCNPGNPDGWGSPNWVDVTAPSEPLQNGCIYGTRNFVFSKEKMYELVSGLQAGVTYAPYQTPCNHGLVAPWAIYSGKYVYFVAPDGVYQTDGGPETSLVENNIKPIFPTKDALGQMVEDVDAVDLERIEDIRLGYHNDELWFMYRGKVTAAIQFLAYDVLKNRWRKISYENLAAQYVYSELSADNKLLLGSNTALYSSGGTSGTDNGSIVPCQIRTGSYDQGAPLNEKEYGNVIFDLNPGGADLNNPIVITPYINGEASASTVLNVTGSGRQQVPLDLSDIYAFNLEFQVFWNRTSTCNPILYQFDILWREEPVSVTHWEARPTSHGMLGYQHVRDMYVEIRSNSIVTLSVTIDDDVTLTFPIASTGGLRKKVYIPLSANKGKLYHWQLDSADGISQFKLYIEGMEVRTKQWLTVLGYETRKPFGGESTLAGVAFESQVVEGGK